MKKSTLQQLLLLVASASLAVGLVACGGDDDDDAGDPTSPAATNTTSSGGPAATNTTASGGNDDNGDDDDVDEVTITMKDNLFEPKNITIPAGEEVEITVKNDGIAVHNMHVLDTDFKSDQLVMAGDESTFEVKFDEPGEYDFQCDYHVPDMVGTITVE